MVSKVRNANHAPVILGGAIGNCVHVAGVFEYLRIAEKYGYVTKFLGAAVDPDRFVEAVAAEDPDIVCVSYRLTPSVLYGLLERFFQALMDRDLIENRKFYFGGTPECVRVAKKFKYFSEFFMGEERFSYIARTLTLENATFGSGTPLMEERLALASPPIDLRSAKNQGYLPMIRHHFGLPSLDDTIKGVREIAESEQVDVISLAPDQNAQEYFFQPERMDPALDGAGGVPIRTEEDLREIWHAAQAGNYPQLRIYAGTNDLLKWAEMSVRVINNAWGTVPLFWYSVLDGRSKRSLEDAIRENREVIRWYAERDIPVEINDAHHWSLRETSDVIAVVDSYLAAYNAKKLGVKKYIAQFMFNTPRMTWGKMDLAKMLAKVELLDELEDDNFVYLKQVRAGLTHFSIDMDVAKGQLAASTILGLALRPQIIHVVSFSEGDHAATPKDVIESCKIVRGVLRNAWQGFPDMTLDPEVQERKAYLVSEARKVIQLMQNYFDGQAEDPLSDAHCLAQMVKVGFLDAPHLKGNPAALGKMQTMPVAGGYDSVDDTGKILAEPERIARLLDGTGEKVKLLKE